MVEKEENYLQWEVQLKLNLSLKKSVSWFFAIKRLCEMVGTSKGIEFWIEQSMPYTSEIFLSLQKLFIFFLSS